MAIGCNSLGPNGLALPYIYFPLSFNTLYQPTDRNKIKEKHFALHHFAFAFLLLYSSMPKASGAKQDGRGFVVWPSEMGKVLGCVVGRWVRCVRRVVSRRRSVGGMGGLLRCFFSGIAGLGGGRGVRPTRWC